MNTLALKIRRYQEDLGLTILCVMLFVASRAMWDAAFPLALLLCGLAPVPLSLAFLRNGNADGMLAAVASLATVAMIFPAAQLAAALAMFMPLLLCGALYGLMQNARAGVGRTLVAGTVSFTVLVMLAVHASGVSDMAAAMARGGEPTAARGAARARLAPLIETLVPAQAGETGSQLAASRETLEAAFAFWFRFPLFFAAATALMLFGAYVALVQHLLARVGVLPASTPFVEWTVPWEYSWALIGAILVLLATLFTGSEMAQCVASNVALIVALPYAVTTFAIAGHMLDRRRVGPLFRLFVYLVVLMHLPYLTLFAMLDPWVDYRRLAAGAPDAMEGPQDEDEE